MGPSPVCLREELDYIGWEKTVERPPSYSYGKPSPPPPGETLWCVLLGRGSTHTPVSNPSSVFLAPQSALWWVCASVFRSLGPQEEQ